MIIRFKASKLKNHMNAEVFAWNVRLDVILVIRVRTVAMENQMMVNPMANRMRFIFAGMLFCVILCYFISLLYLFLVMLLFNHGLVMVKC